MPPVIPVVTSLYQDTTILHKGLTQLISFSKIRICLNRFLYKKVGELLLFFFKFGEELHHMIFIYLFILMKCFKIFN